MFYARQGKADSSRTRRPPARHVEVSTQQPQPRAKESLVELLTA